MTRGPKNPERSFGVSVGAVLLVIAAPFWWRGCRPCRGPRRRRRRAAAVLWSGRRSSRGRALHGGASRALGYVNARVLLTVLFRCCWCRCRWCGVSPAGIRSRAAARSGRVVAVSSALSRSSITNVCIEGPMSNRRVFAEFWEFLRQEKKYWLVPIVIVRRVRPADGVRPVERRGAVHLHAVLCRPAFSASRPTTTIRRPVSSRTAGSWPPRRKSASRARSTTRAFRRTRSRTACARRASPRELDLVGFYEKPLVKFERLLETYVGLRAARLRSYLMAMPLWLSDKLWMADDITSSSTATGESCSATTTNRTPRRRSIRRRSNRRRSSRWTASASGRRRRSGSGAGTRSRCSASCAFRTRSACCIRRSPISPVSGELRRIQGDGARAVRRAEVREADQGPSGRDPRRWQPVDEHGVLHLSPRADDDRDARSSGCSAARRASRKASSRSARWIWRGRFRRSPKK